MISLEYEKHWVGHLFPKNNPRRLKPVMNLEIDQWLESRNIEYYWEDKPFTTQDDSLIMKWHWNVYFKNPEDEFLFKLVWV